jgi:hypothetical protein
MPLKNVREMGMEQEARDLWMWLHCQGYDVKADKPSEEKEVTPEDFRPLILF